MKPRLRAALRAPQQLVSTLLLPLQTVSRKIRSVGLHRVPEFSRFWFYSQALICIACLFWFEYQPGWATQGPGVAIAVLGALAVVIAFRVDAKLAEKAGWIILSIVLVLFEMSAIRVERATQVTEQRELTERDLIARDEQTRSFHEVLSNGRDLFRSLSDEQALTRQNLDMLSGADSYCYLNFVPGQGFLAFVHVGSYPLYGVEARIVRLEENGHVDQLNLSGTTVSVGDMIRGHANIQPVPMGLVIDQGFFNANIFFTARNGDWVEQMRVRKIGGQYIRALFVRGRFASLKREEPMCETIDPGFPRDKDGNIDSDFRIPSAKLPRCQ